MSISDRVAPLFSLLVVVSHLSLNGALGSASPCNIALSPSVLHHILHVEPNLFLQHLGNVSDTPGSLKRTFLDAGHRRAAALLQEWMTAAGMETWIDTVGNVRGRPLSSHPTAPSIMIGSHYDTVIDGGKFDGALGVIVGIAAVKALVLEAAVAAGAITPVQIEQAINDLAIEATAGSGGGGGGVKDAHTFESGILDIHKLLRENTQQEELHSSSALFSLERPVEVVAFSDEEGVRFQSTFLGSKALTGALVSSGGIAVRDAQGKSLLDALRDNGFAETINDIQSAALPSGALAGYIEVHLEQGPVLEEEGSSLGVVTGIAGQSRLLITIKGMQGHAGTVPMRLRKDPLAGAAEIITQIENLCRAVSLGNDAATLEEGAGKREKRGNKGSVYDDEVIRDDAGIDPSLVCTVGALTLWPGASNVIPGAANFTLDIRSHIDTSRKSVVDAINSQIQSICQRRGLDCGVELRHAAAAVHCDPQITAALETAVLESKSLLLKGEFGGGVLEKNSCGNVESIEREGALGSCPAIDGGSATSNLINIKAAGEGYYQTVTKLVSGAGHDAMAMSSITHIGMLFVRCTGGISHSPEEYVSPDDVASSTAALLHYLRAWQVNE